jgi:hypothetical protein
MRVCFDLATTTQKTGDQRQRQETVRNGRAKRPGLGTFDVHMDPLVVARGLGKQVDLLLGDGDPVADGHFLAHQGRQFCKCLKGFHGNGAPPL